MTDLSLNREIANELKRFRELVFLDHHISSVRHQEGLEGCIVDTSKCGTMLVYEHIRSMGYDEEDDEYLAHIVDDHDLWRNRMPESDRLSALLGMLERDNFIDELLDADVDLVLGRHSKEIDIKIQSRNNYVAGVKCYEPDTKDGLRRCVVFAERYTSYVGDRFLSEGYDVVYIVNFFSCTVSLRSRVVDVSKIAERNGGGGHPKAAGYTLAEETEMSFCDTILNHR